MGWRKFSVNDKAMLQPFCLWVTTMLQYLKDNLFPCLIKVQVCCPDHRLSYFVCLSITEVNMWWYSTWCGYTAIINSVLTHTSSYLINQARNLRFHYTRHWNLMMWQWALEPKTMLQRPWNHNFDTKTMVFYLWNKDHGASGLVLRLWYL